MSSPIQRRVGQVFIPVRHLDRSIDWYAAVLGFEAGHSSHGGTIFDIPADGEVGLALDANCPDFDPSGPPRFFLWTEDIEATLRHLRSLDVTITSAVEDIGSVVFVQFEDPDGNPLMVCERS
jgi:catechol 2,3-dioxygenase-like lactoylglutathione lyase family enzyme